MYSLLLKLITMKIIKIKGCKDCPYNKNLPFINGNRCIKYNIVFHQIDKIPETPHPDCKLDDAPMGSNLDLKKMEEQLDKALKEETTETLTTWINEKRKTELGN